MQRLAKYTVSGMVIVLIALLTVMFVSAQQQRGCCCDGTTGNYQSLTPFSDANFCNQGFYFMPLTLFELSATNYTCVDKCAASINQTPSAICGDNICNSTAGENVANCPLDCKTGISPVGCGIGIKPPPGNLTIAPLKGEQGFRIDFVLPCPTDSIKVSRCDSIQCDLIATIPQTDHFIDRDASLKFDTDYTYKLVAEYLVQNAASVEVNVTSNLGDLECLEQTTNDEFCISKFFYNKFMPYLQQNSYPNSPEGLPTWQNNFDFAVERTFNTRFEKSWQCNDVNRLFLGSVQCSANEMCIKDSVGVSCIVPSPCALGDNPFGLFYDVDSCEGISTNRKYCFYDRSQAGVDNCFDCHAGMRCYDYKSKRSCEKNNCGIGLCEWRPMFPELGVGVCIDTRFNNCPNCESEGTADAPNEGSANLLFEQCSVDKAQALSTTKYPCFYNKNLGQSTSCDLTSCMDYSPTTQCNPNPSGITLSSTNKLLTKSTDPCNIGVCEVEKNSAGTLVGCVKNADGDDPSTTIGWQDCPAGDRVCELDHYSPNTRIVPTGVSGRYDYLEVRILDKINGTTNPQDKTGAIGYKTFICVVTASNTCDDAKNFNIKLNATRMTVQNLKLMDGVTVLSPLKFGDNVIKYYSKDAANNPEEVKEIKIVACDNCSGPKVVHMEISNGQEVSGNWWTIDNIPIITITFNEPTTIRFAGLSKGTDIIPVETRNPQGSFKHTLIPKRAISGTYVFAIDAVNPQKVGMDPPLTFNLTFDDQSPDVIISPPDKTPTSANSLTIALDFTEPALLNSVTVNDLVRVSGYMYQLIPTEISDKMQTSDKKNFVHRLTNLKSGKKILIIDAEDFAGNKVTKQSTFYVQTGLTEIRLTEPNFGTFSTPTFPVIVETSNNAECKWIYDTPTPPAATQNTFDFLTSRFDQTYGLLHKINVFNKIPSGDTNPHTIHVICKDQFGIAVETFELHLDTTPPAIVTAYAHPNPIAESEHPVKKVYETVLNIQLSEEGFCRYSKTQTQFEKMENKFSGYGLIPKTSHTVTVTENAVKQYSYNVACVDLGGLKTSTIPINFNVDLNAPLTVISTTLQTSATKSIGLAVETNKRAFCFYGTSSNDLTTPFSAGGLERIHKAVVQSNTSAGTMIYFTKCNKPDTGEVTPVINISVFVDDTAPILNDVSDASVYSDTKISYFTDRLRITIDAEDPESNISAYKYKIEEGHIRRVVRDWTTITATGKSFYATGLNLANDTLYIVTARVINGVGAESGEKSSDGVRVNTAVYPGVHGLQFPPQSTSVSLPETILSKHCPGLACIKDADCESDICLNQTCRAPTCDDGRLSTGFDTDVDCGGNCSISPFNKPCPLNKKCLIDSDCALKLCKANLCIQPGPCENKIKDGSESDEDCGGSCPGCALGKNCNYDSDCAPNICEKPLEGGNVKICRILNDKDNDGIDDERDKCDNTPQSETPDNEGCADSQKFSCGDTIDDRWRKEFFGKVDCDDGAPNKDFDKDGLTNLEEYNLWKDKNWRLNPVKRDTDGDGFSDGREVSAGTDPMDEKTHPTPLWIIILIWIVVLAALGAGGYFGYKGYSMYMEKKRKEEAARIAKEKAEKERKRKEAERKRKAEEIRRKKEAKKRALEKKLGRLERKKEAPSEYVEVGKIQKKKAPVKKDSVKEKLARLKRHKK
ncbi:hypothetical protein ACFLZN_01220 [Nanoarchaeota archaeon]